MLRRDVGQPQGVPEIGREAEPAREDRQRKAGNDLARAQRDDEEGMDRGHDQARERGREDGEQEHERRRARRPLRGPEAHHRSDQHHPLDTQVEHARPLCQELAERREEDRSAVRDRLREHRDGERVVDAHVAVSAVGASLCPPGRRSIDPRSGRKANPGSNWRSVRGLSGYLTWFRDCRGCLPIGAPALRRHRERDDSSP